MEQIHADFFIGAHFVGFRERMEHPLLLDMAIHTFDQARFLLGSAKAETALCMAFNPASSWYDGCASAIRLGFNATSANPSRPSAQT